MAIFNVTAADTGLTSSDSIQHTFRTLDADTGLTVSDSLVTLRNHKFSVTGLTVTSTIVRISASSLSNTGLTVSDSIVFVYIKERSSGDTALTITDAIQKFKTGVITDEGLAVAGNIYIRNAIATLPIYTSPLTPPIIGTTDTTLKYEWTIKHFNYDGSTPISADYSGYSFNTTSNEVFHATNRSMNFYLNGIDDCGFSLYLDDPMAALITPTKSVIKVYRTIYTADGTTIIYQDGNTYPCFAGTVASSIKNGDSNTMDIKAFSPLWRLQSRFHVFNHYLVTDQETGDPYTGTGLIFKFITLLNAAFPATGDAYTGIEPGLRNWIDEPHISPYFVAKGSNTWSLIFDDIMSRPAAADIIPLYIDDTTNVMMILDTDEKRGDDISSGIQFRYHTTNSNCDNITQNIEANPNEFANYLWVIGQGGANSGKVAVAWDNASGDFDSNSIGMYMKTIDKSEIKRLSALPPIAEAELKQSRWPKFSYSVDLSPYGGLVYNYHYKIGDVVGLVATKGALNVSAKQRIYQVGLAMSDNNVEVASPLIANDFYGKVASEGSTLVISTSQPDSGGTDSGSGGNNPPLPPPTPSTLTAGFTYSD